MNKFMPSFSIPIVIVALMMAWALYPNNPYGYYIFLRWVCCPLLAYFAFQSLKRDWPSLPWVLGILALLYNPIFPIHLNRAIWSFLNVGTLGVLGIFYYLALLPSKELLEKCIKTSEIIETQFETLTNQILPGLSHLKGKATESELPLALYRPFVEILLLNMFRGLFVLKWCRGNIDEFVKTEECSIITARYFDERKAEILNELIDKKGIRKVKVRDLIVKERNNYSKVLKFIGKTKNLSVSVMEITVADTMSFLAVHDVLKEYLKGKNDLPWLEDTLINCLRFYFNGNVSKDAVSGIAEAIRDTLFNDGGFKRSLETQMPTKELSDLEDAHACFEAAKKLFDLNKFGDSVKLLDHVINKYKNKREVEFAKVVARSLFCKGLNISRLNRKEEAVKIYLDFVEKYNNWKEEPIIDLVKLARQQISKIQPNN